MSIPSVGSGHAGVVSKRLNVSWKFFYRWIDNLSGFLGTTLHKIVPVTDSVTFSGALNTGKV